jgi:hypothetical protein
MAAAVAHGETDARLRVTVGGGLDSNARRDFEQVGEGEVVDGMVSVVGSVEARALFERAQLLGSYDGGVRQYLRLPSEDVLVQSAQTEASMALGRTFGVGLLGRGRDRRGGERDYTDLAASGFVDFVPDRSLSLRGFVGGHRFIYWPRSDYSYGATELGMQARYRLDRRHALMAFGEGGRRRYGGLARDREGTLGPERRADTVLQVGAGWAWRGPVALGVTYAFVDQSSNSRGESLNRHRLSGTAGIRLPWQLFLFTQLNAQLTDYPDGIYLSAEVENLTEDAENHNSVSLRLVRPLSPTVDAELRYALYQNSLPQNELDYLRQVGWIGLTWRP